MNTRTQGFSLPTIDIQDFIGDIREATLPVFTESDDFYDCYFKNIDHCLNDQLLFENSSDILNHYNNNNKDEASNLI